MTTEIFLVFAVLAVTIVLFVTEKLRIDVIALLVAVSASNSFVLPTHQVNALYMSPGGYRNKDYLRAGSIMSVICIFVSVGMIYSFYLNG